MSSQSLPAQLERDLSPAERQDLLQEVLKRLQAKGDPAAADVSTDAALSRVTGSRGIGNDEEDLPEDLRRAFLHLVRQDPALLDQEEVATFLANEIEPEDFDTLQWESPEHMVEFCDALYGIRFPTPDVTERVRHHVRFLIRQALQQYEQQDEREHLYQLLRVAPTSLMMDDPELLRLRHLAQSYEIRRVRRNRWWLYAYLLVQVLLIVVVFPYLFINAENGALQRQVEQLADVEIGDEGYRLFSYLDGLYWAVITAGSIGYGDITPYTAIGKVIAGVLGTMGVITAGVIAGLVLKWITPRRLD